MSWLRAVANRLRRPPPQRTPPLLITSSVHPYAPFVKLSDSEKRISLALDAIEKWLTLSPKLRIVLCDGSSFDFSDLVEMRFPGAGIECLFFENDQNAVSRYGKGWGEGEIVNYALRNSLLLRKAPYFAKCTSRIFVRNFEEILCHWNGTLLCDVRAWSLGSPDKFEIEEIDTMFYVVDKALYLDKFSAAHLNVRDLERHYLEHCFADVVLGENIERFLVPIMPLYEGVSGTSAEPYPPISAQDLQEDARRRKLIGKATNYLSSS